MCLPCIVRVRLCVCVQREIASSLAPHVRESLSMCGGIAREGQHRFRIDLSASAMLATTRQAEYIPFNSHHFTCSHFGQHLVGSK